MEISDINFVTSFFFGVDLRIKSRIILSQDSLKYEKQVI